MEDTITTKEHVHVLQEAQFTTVVANETTMQESAGQHSLYQMLGETIKQMLPNKIARHIAMFSCKIRRTKYELTHGAPVNLMAQCSCESIPHTPPL